MVKHFHVLQNIYEKLNKNIIFCQFSYFIFALGVGQLAGARKLPLLSRQHTSSQQHRGAHWKYPAQVSAYVRSCQTYKVNNCSDENKMWKEDGSPRCLWSSSAITNCQSPFGSEAEWARGGLAQHPPPPVSQQMWTNLQHKRWSYHHVHISNSHKTCHSQV